LLKVIGAEYVMMIHAFFDESGTDTGSSVVCVAGYVFETEQVVRFNVEWQEVLDQFGLKFFHMVDCAHGTGEFAGRGKKERIEIEARCIGIIKRRALFGLVASVAESDYMEIAAGRHGLGGAYVICLQWCITGVAAWVEKHEIQGSIAYFFEAGHALQSIANAAMNDLSMRPVIKEASLYNSHTFIPKSGALALQAADLLAWQWHRDWVNRFGPKRRARRLDLESLLKLRHMQAHLDRKHLAAMILRGGGYSMEELRSANRI
jgi:hypothetical protein